MNTFSVDLSYMSYTNHHSNHVCWYSWALLLISDWLLRDNLECTQNIKRIIFISDESTSDPPPLQPFCWPWPPAVVYETSVEERLLKSIAPLGQAEGHWYWPLRYGRWPLHVVQTAALDSCCTPTQKGGIKAEAELTVCMHTPFFCLFVKELVSVWCLWERLSRNKSRKEKRKSWKKRFERQLRAWWWKRNPCTAESEPSETPLWRNEPTALYHNAAIENTREDRKRTKRRDGKSGFRTQKKELHSGEWLQFALAQRPYCLKGTLSCAGKTYDWKMKSERLFSGVCMCVVIRPRCSGWVSVKGYIDEQIARLQSVTVNERSAHDIISLLTCAVILLCLPWKTRAGEEWRERGLKYSPLLKGAGSNMWSVE